MATTLSQKTDVDNWRHIPSGENIADILTKGAKPDKRGPISVWQCGPEWLTKDENEWPVTNIIKLTEDEKNDVQKFVKSTKKVSTFVNKIDVELPQFDVLIAKCGKLEKLIRCAAFILRLMGRTRQDIVRNRSSHGGKLSTGMIVNFLKTGERKKIDKSVNTNEYIMHGSF